MKNFEVKDFSRYGVEPVNLAYVEKAERLVRDGKSSQVSWARLVRMLHYCVLNELEAPLLVSVLGTAVDPEELKAYCHNLKEWNDTFEWLNNFG